MSERAATYLGVDVGTSMTKVVLVSSAGDVLCTRRARSRLVHRAGGGVEQDVEEVITGVVGAIREVGRDVGSPPALVALTGQGDGCWLLDEAGAPLRPAISWMDGRAAPVLEAWRRSGVAASVERRTANALFPGSQACILAWLREHEPAVLARAASAAYCKDAVLQRLTGLRATDPSDASAPFGDPLAGGYDAGAIAACQLSSVAPLLAPIAQPLPVASLSGQASAASGLAEATVVTAGPFDLAASPIGAGVRDTGEALLTVGTTLACLSVVDHLEADGVGMHLATGRERRWLRVLPAMVGTACVDWVLETLRLDPRELEAMLGRSPAGANGLVMLPYLAPSGERAPFVAPGARGQLAGLSLTTTAEDIVRAACEGVAFAARECFAAMVVRGPVRICGGGARSPGWVQIFADVLGVAVEVVPTADVAARGALLAAAEAVGVLDLAEQWCPPGKLVEPRADEAERYAECFGRYKEHQASARRLWQAPR